MKSWYAHLFDEFLLSLVVASQFFDLLPQIVLDLRVSLLRTLQLILQQPATHLLVSPA